VRGGIGFDATDRVPGHFDSLLEAKVFTEDWRIDYNINRPHSAHGWLSPVEFVEAWLSKQQLTLA
jgi:putative transposase